MEKCASGKKGREDGCQRHPRRDATQPSVCVPPFPHLICSKPCQAPHTNASASLPLYCRHPSAELHRLPPVLIWVIFSKYGSVRSCYSLLKPWKVFLLNFKMNWTTSRSPQPHRSSILSSTAVTNHGPSTGWVLARGTCHSCRPSEHTSPSCFFTFKF